MPRDRFLHKSLGTLQNDIQKSRVLMVGAGGIGCELLKNLVLTGFGEIHVVDLDTIDLSNLNRQFLFRHEHIKRPKALVAKESAGPFNPNVTIEAHHANIKDPEFDVSWFQGFNIVFNALDNFEARRHVNRMCVEAEVPLIESGTTGYNGQTQVIVPGKTECYDCTGKETNNKTFPVCTIRSTPSQAIHCIVWAKSYLFAEVFGTSEDDAPDMDNTETSDNAQEVEKLRQEAQALKVLRDSMGSKDFPRMVFDKVFTEDINRLLSMEDMWKNRRKPEPLDFDKLKEEAAANVDPDIAAKDQVVWTRAQNFVVFISSLQRLSVRLEEARTRRDVGNAAAVLSFDKDDRDTLDFVAASANLRSTVFGIDSKSEFDIKQMAGNIIPAIATTNAMTAGLCVLQAFHAMREQRKIKEERNYGKTKMVFLAPYSSDRAIVSEHIRPPRPDCAICGVTRVRIEVDLSRATLKDIVDSLLKTHLAYADDLSVRLQDNDGLLYDADFDDNLEKKLRDLDIKVGSSLEIVDESDEAPRVNVVLRITAKEIAAEELPVTLLEKFEIARKPKSEPAMTNGTTNGTHGTNGHSAVLATNLKRSADEAGLEADIASKRGKVMDGAAKAEGEVIDDDGTINIEDD
ncbi:hypothetical protein FH972_022341 [Carpinus fangiana]|uniref:SUMO-activating enzyme subunit n=1 Tax=Carpinus fangiana TaxID=176857 RepID=A0A5N6KU78_9ROSI|nr:hypothetical protein FH972_022341 [Carpinus fangiana]